MSYYENYEILCYENLALYGISLVFQYRYRIGNMYKIVADTNINGVMYMWSIELLVKSFLAYCNK